MIRRNGSSAAKSARLDSDVRRVMNEVGIELSDDPPRSLADFRGEDFDMMVVLRPRGGQDVPPLSGVPNVIYWSFASLDDDKTTVREERLAVARRMRDELRTRVGLLVSTIARASAG
jgi:protein-tyrosine-phosphatase